MSFPCPRLFVALFLALVACDVACADDLIPAASRIKPDRPRLLLRPQATPYAISLDQLKSLPRDADFNRMLLQLKGQNHAAAQAMVWLLSGDDAAAQRAVEKMRAYRYPGNVDTFHIYLRLTELSLAYDWLYDYPGFTEQIKAEVRAHVAPLAEEGIRVSNDHMFHNYIWMSAGGVALWGMATAGEDRSCDAIWQRIRQRFNAGLFPTWRYLDGLPSEPMGYWSLYVFTPGALTILAAQSAYETDLVNTIRTQQDAWFDRHFENLIQSTLPSMRFISWGDLQSGPNGGVTHEMAGIVDAVTWALRSPQGVWFSRWLREKRALARFHGETAIFSMLYTNQLPSESTAPPLSFLAGNEQSGHFIVRSSWDDEATVVTFRSTDHFGDHHHYDQGSFMIYREGLLAVDPPVYQKTRGPQQKTEYHNTLLVDGQPQRGARGQWFKTIEEFKKNLQSGRKLETGDILFSHDAGTWTTVAGQFAQAYDCEALESCVRQMLFVRPDKVIIVDRLRAANSQRLPQVQWLLQLPDKPRQDGEGFLSSNGKSWIRCREVLPSSSTVRISATPMNTYCVAFTYPESAGITLVHMLEVGDESDMRDAIPIHARQVGTDLEFTVEGQQFRFAGHPTYHVECRQEKKG